MLSNEPLIDNREIGMRKLVSNLALLTLCASTLAAGSFDEKDMCKDGSNHKRGWSGEIREIEISMRDEVDLDAGQNGGVSVEGWDQDRIVLLAAVSA